jgi:hypothetical protein
MDALYAQGFRSGSILVWVNPRCHRFDEDTVGARIEGRDYANVFIRESSSKDTSAPSPRASPIDVS